MSPRFECFGHRGAAGHAPENTLRAVECGLALGATGIEVDVHLVDGQLVVIHDDTFERTTNGVGVVAESSLAYLRSLDAGGGERVPLLDEVADLVVGRGRLNIELKGRATGDAVAQWISTRVRAGGCAYDEFIVSSFDHRQLLEVSRIEKRILCGALLYGIPVDLAACGSALGAYSIHPSIDFLSDELLEDSRKRGLKVLVYTVNTPERVAAVRRLGVDGVFTDYPEIIR